MGGDRRRSTSDLLVLLIAATVCGSVFLSVLVTAVLAFTQPDEDHPGAVTLVADSLQMLMSLLAGFLAGRSNSRRDDDADDD